MALQMASIAKLLVAHIAFKSETFPLSMHPLMSLQIAGITETSITQVTFVRFLLCMRQHMSLQIARMHKRLVALLAHIRPLRSALMLLSVGL